MDSSEHQNQMTYKAAMEGGLLNSYETAIANGLEHHYEAALECGDIGINTKKEVDAIFGVPMGRFKTSVTEVRTKPEYYIFKQFQYKCAKEKETHSLRIEIEALRRSHTEIRDKYNELKKEKSEN